MKTLEPGTYKLSRDVKNPTPDRRFKNDWRFRPEWKAGTEFLVVGKTHDMLTEEDVANLNVTEEQRAKIRRKVQYVAICLVGHRWAHDSIGPGQDEQFAALADALEPCDESHDAFFTRLGVRAGFAQWLVTSGKFSPTEFEQLWDEYWQSDDTPSEPQVSSAPSIDIPTASDEL